MHSGVTHERCADFRHGKKKKQKRGEFITPPRPTGRRSNNGQKPCPEILTFWGWGHYSRTCGSYRYRRDKLKSFEYGELKIHFQSDGIDPGRGFLMTYFLADRLADNNGKYSMLLDMKDN